MPSAQRPRASSPDNAELPARTRSIAIAVELFIPIVSLLLALDQLLVIVPDLYLHAEGEPSKLTWRLVLVGSGVVGWFGSKTIDCAAALLLASIGVALTGVAEFLAFGQSHGAVYWASLPGVLGLFGIGGSIAQYPRLLLARAQAVDLTSLLLHPLVLASFVAGLCTAAVFENAIGPIRAGLAIGGGLAAAAMIASTQACPRALVLGLEFRALLRSGGAWLIIIYAWLAYSAEQRLPLHRILTSSHPIVYFAASERCTVSVTSGQGAYHLFVDGELRFSTFDDKRWAEALVLPALSRVPAPKRALVLSTGEGLLERELLRDQGLLAITSVARCRLVAEIARKSGWMRRLTTDAMNSPRVTFVERNPAVYLSNADRQPFDLVLVDLPDPADPLASKYYSRYFYQLLAARMTDASVLVVQATSARRSPRTFATIGATLAAAGFKTQPLVVPLISRGEWSLYLAAKVPVPSPMRREWIQHGLVATMPEQFYHPWPDTLPPRDFVAEPSTLHNGRVRDWFARESESEPSSASASSATNAEDDIHG